eukprot:3936342-Ditylum_brightwellii.AAC.1
MDVLASISSPTSPKIYANQSMNQGKATVLIPPEGSTDEIIIQDIATGDIHTLSPTHVTNLNPASVDQITEEEIRDHFVPNIPWVKLDAK